MESTTQSFNGFVTFQFKVAYTADDRDIFMDEASLKEMAAERLRIPVDQIEIVEKIELTNFPKITLEDF